MKQRIVDYFPCYMYSIFSVLLALGYEHNDVPSSFIYIMRTFGISGWIIIFIFMFGAIITAFVNLDYRLRAIALIPLLLYGIVTPYAFQIQASGSQFYTSLITSHFYACFAFGLIIHMLVLHDNHLQRKDNARLLGEIQSEREQYEAIAGVHK